MLGLPFLELAVEDTNAIGPLFVSNAGLGILGLIGESLDRLGGPFNRYPDLGIRRADGSFSPLGERLSEYPAGTVLRGFPVTDAKTAARTCKRSDARTTPWSPLAEIERDYDCDRPAHVAIPDAMGYSREWHVYARSVPAELLRAQQHAAQASNHQKRLRVVGCPRRRGRLLAAVFFEVIKQGVDCGYEENADLVGAINILARGHRVAACGEPAQSGRSVKQEPAEANTQSIA